MSRWRVLSQVVLVAVQVACVMSSYCESRLWQFWYVVVPWGGVCPVMDGRFLLELVSPKYKANSSSNFFYFGSVLVQTRLRPPLGTALRACRRPAYGDLYLRPLCSWYRNLAKIRRTGAAYLLLNLVRQVSFYKFKYLCSCELQRSHIRREYVYVGVKYAIYTKIIT